MNLSAWSVDPQTFPQPPWDGGALHCGCRNHLGHRRIEGHRGPRSGFQPVAVGRGESPGPPSQQQCPHYPGPKHSGGSSLTPLSSGLGEDSCLRGRGPGRITRPTFSNTPLAQVAPAHTLAQRERFPRAWAGTPTETRSGGGRCNSMPRGYRTGGNPHRPGSPHRTATSQSVPSASASPRRSATRRSASPACPDGGGEGERASDPLATGAQPQAPSLRPAALGT